MTRWDHAVEPVGLSRLTWSFVVAPADFDEIHPQSSDLANEFECFLLCIGIALVRCIVRRVKLYAHDKRGRDYGSNGRDHTFEECERMGVFVIANIGLYRCAVK